MKNQTLEMVRGDTLSFAIEIEFDSDPQQLDTATFCVKKNYDDDGNVFKKSLGDGIEYVETIGKRLYYTVRVAPADTQNVTAGQYYYDLEIQANGDTFTILKGILNIEQDMTR